MKTKFPIFYTSASAMGDVLCSTPTIRKISQIYRSKVIVVSKHNYLFKNSPYISKTIPFEDFIEENYSSEYDIHKTFFYLGKKDPLGIEFKHAICDIRQFHAKDLGFMLSSKDLSCDYFPDSFESCMEKIHLPENYVVIHPSKTWDSRTWPKEQWQKLVDALNSEGIYVVSIGKDSSEMGWKSVQEKPIFDIDIKLGVDLTNKTTIDQLWHIINLSRCVITMDSGVLHLAGTTNSEIIQLGSSIDPEFRSPYRKGSQNYKYSYISGECNLNCASDLYYSLKEWGEIQSVPLIGTCLESKPSFECNPGWRKTFSKVLEVYNRSYDLEENFIEERLLRNNDHKDLREDILQKESIKVSYRDGCKVEILGEETDQRIFDVEFWDLDKGTLVHSSSLRINHWARTSRKWFTNWKVTVKVFGEVIFEDQLNLENKKVLINSPSSSFGDSVCWTPYFLEFQNKHKCHVTVQSNFYPLKRLVDSYYPIVKFEEWGTYELEDERFYASYRIEYGVDKEKHKKGIQSLNSAFKSGKNLKYVDIGSVWNKDLQPNHPHLIPLQKIGSDCLGLEYKEIRPSFSLPETQRPMKEKYICISEFASSEGMKEWKNPIGWQKLVDLLSQEGFKIVSISREKSNLKGIIKRNGDFSLEDRCHWLQHCEFFIGVSSGLSWLAWACGKKVVTISGATNMWNEFLENNLRIINPGACHGCWNHPVHTDKLVCFHSSFCPTDKNFECTRKISPSGVFEKIKKNIIDEIVEDSILIKVESKALGDSIGALCAIEEYRKKSGKKVGVICNFYSNFVNSYPEISFYPYPINPIPSEEVFLIGLEKYKEFKSIDYRYNEPLIEGYASQLGVKMDPESAPKWDFKIGPKPIKEKYFCFSTHSTAQAKHWNFPGGWQELCNLLVNRGYLPVCIDQYSSFGNSENMNPIPDNCINRTGMDLGEVCNYIYHSEFFIGVSSGLSWLSHAIGKHVVMISGLTSSDHEFQNNITRISNPEVCHGCFNNPDKYPFDKNDWMWCPEHKGTDRHFECSKTISPSHVMEKIKNLL